MLRVVIFDGGHGGKLFADRLEAELPVIEIIRVIDRAHADLYLRKPKIARALTAEALRPYIGKVDLIIFANHLISLTSLKYFRRKYSGQRFLGLELKAPDTFVKRDVLIITTRAITKTIGYRSFIMSLKRRAKVLTVDTWPAKIDTGTLTEAEINKTITEFIQKKHLHPQEVILGCSQFEHIVPDLKRLLGHRTRIYSSFDSAIREACKALRIRGGARKIK